MLPDLDDYVLDLHNARDVPVDAGRFGLDEYIEHLIEFMQETVRAPTSSRSASRV